MDTSIIEIAERIKGLRELSDYTPEEVAEAVNVPLEKYLEYESGTCDLSFTFLNNVAAKLGVDIVELLTGENPHLSRYCVVRKGKGLNITRRKGFKYEHLGYRFKNKLAECFLVKAPYIEEEQDKPIIMSRHAGQEFDYIISGSLKCQFCGQTEILNAGDSVYYNSAENHGMIATGGEECVFLAITIHGPNKENK